MKTIIKRTFLLFALTSISLSCAKDKTQEEELITLPDYAYGAKVLPGKNRAKISFVINDKIKKCEILWNKKQNSKVIDMSKLTDHNVNALIENLPEGPITFEIAAYDAQNGYSSILIKTNIYGDKYFENLNNREIRELVFRYDAEAGIEWLNPKTGEVGMELTYTGNDDKPHLIKIPKNQVISAIPNYKPNTDLTYTSLYLPQDNALDTMRVAERTIPAPTYYSKAVGSIVSKSGLVYKFTSQTYEKVGNGLEYASVKYLDVNNSPYSLNILRIDLNDPKLSIRTLMPDNRNSFGTQTVKLMAENLQNSGQNVLAATNGDFYESSPVMGTPLGPVFFNGAILKDFAKYGTIAYFAIKKDGKPEIGIYSALAAANYNQYREMIGGSAKLVSGGTPIVFNDSTKEPRTFIGYSINNIAYLVVVDGRQSTHSVGMTFDQMASIMSSLGTQEAVNLDGGGSTTMVLKNSSNVFDIKNKYSDANPRAVANGLAVIFNP